MGKLSAIRKFSHPILLYTLGWLQSLLQHSNLNHPHSCSLVSNCLRTLSFYLSSTCSKVDNCYIIEYGTKLLILVKRILVQLSHPHIRGQNNNTQAQGDLAHGEKSFTHQFPDLMEALLATLTAVLDNSNKYIDKLICNLFVKNVYFMETLQNYFVFLAQGEKVLQIITCLKFYRRCLETYSGVKNGHKN